MIKAIILKQFTSGSVKGLSFNDQIEIRVPSELRIMDLIDKDIEASAGPNYKIVNIALWDTESNDYVTRKQAHYALGGK